MQQPRELNPNDQLSRPTDQLGRPIKKPKWAYENGRPARTYHLHITRLGERKQLPPIQRMGYCKRIIWIPPGKSVDIPWATNNLRAQADGTYQTVHPDGFQFAVESIACLPHKSEYVSQELEQHMIEKAHLSIYMDQPNRHISDLMYLPLQVIALRATRGHYVAVEHLPVPMQAIEEPPIKKPRETYADAVKHNL